MKTTTITEELNVQVGDVFAYSWGYDQTNVDFVKVVKVTPKSVRIVPVSCVLMDSDGYGNDKVVPGEELPADHYKYRRLAGIKRVRATTSNYWNGSAAVEVTEPVLDFDHGIGRRVQFAETVHATSSGWGH